MTTSKHEFTVDKRRAYVLTYLRDAMASGSIASAHDAARVLGRSPQSGATFAALKIMEEHGLVERIDQRMLPHCKKPAWTWRITDAGLEQLNEHIAARGEVDYLRN